MKKLKRTGIAIFAMVAVFAVYVEMANRNTANMTYRQKILKAIYPAFIWWTNLTGVNTKKLLHDPITPAVPLYGLKIISTDGKSFDLASFAGRKILLVNTASDCGYTDQYEALEKLYKQYTGKLEVIAFPSNDFKEQEKGSNTDISQFCKINFGTSFPIMAKSGVKKGPGQSAVFQWLTDPAKNGWNEQEPTWNFSKYLVDEKGRLTGFFGPSVTPLSDAVINELNK